MELAYCQAEPNMDDDLRYVVRLVESRGILLGRQGHHEEAIADYDFNLRYLSPEESQDTHVLRAVAMVRMGKVADGISAVARVLEQSPKSGRTLYSIACVFAVAAAVEPERKEEFASKSMGMLQNSLKHGFWDVDLMTKDPDLLFLRSRKDFAELVAAMRVRMGEEKKVGPIQ